MLSHHVLHYCSLKLLVAEKKTQIGNNLMGAIEQRKYDILSGRNPIFRNFEQILISPNLSNWSDDKVNQK